MPKLRDLIDDQMKVKMGEVRTDKDYPPFAKTESEWKKQWTEKKPVNERLDSTTLKRMEGMHNRKYMKQLLNAASMLHQQMEEEGFDSQDIYSFINYKINKTNL